jgi:PHD/YefM family antitoxin component YafN of YafNO toxin-antitoxin module
MATHKFTVNVESDKPVVVISLEEYESLIETIEVLKDEAVLYDIRMAEKELKEGKTVDWEDLKKELDAN